MNKPMRMAEWRKLFVATSLLGAWLSASAQISSQPQSQDVYEGMAARFAVEATGAAPTYQWRKNGGNILNATNKSLVFPSAVAGDNGNYDVVVTVGGTPTTSSTARLTVRPVVPLSQGLAGYWKLDETSGTTAADSSGAGHPGTVVGNPGDQWTAGRVGGAMNFRGQGVNDYISVKNLPMPTDGTFTFSVWLWKDPAMEADGWRLVYFTSVDGPFSLRNDGSSLRPGVYQSDGTLVTAKDPTPMPASTWVHLVMVADGAKLRFYRDGTEVASTAYNGTVKAVANPATTEFTLGAFLNPALTANAWKGKMDDVAYWTRGLSASEVQLLYAAGFNALSFPPLNLTAGSWVTNWVAFNDHSPSDLTAANVTGYDMMAGEGGPLTNFVAGRYPAGQPLAVRMSATLTGSVAYSGTMSDPDSGTPAYDLFMPEGTKIVDLSNTPNPGILFTRGQAGRVTVAISGLDPTMRYVLRTTSVRGRDTADLETDERWTVATLGSADALADFQTPGVVTTDTYPPATLTFGQAAWNSGRNMTGTAVSAGGEVVGWSQISPGADGLLNLISEQYAGPIPLNYLGEPGTGNGAYGYGPIGVMLMEVGPLSPVTIATQPPAELAAFQARPFSMSVRATGTTPIYQWYKDGVGAIAGETQATYSRAAASASDEGDYYVTVSNSFGSVTSSKVHVTLVQDNTPPTIAYAVGSATMDTVSLTFSEMVDPSTANKVAAYQVLNGATPLAVTAVTLLNNGMSVQLTTATQPENTLLTVQCPTVVDLAGNAMAGGKEFRTWMSGTCAGVTFEVFGGIGGGVAIADLTGNPIYPDSPTAVHALTMFNTVEVTDGNYADNYGGRIYGLFVPPVAGNWRFFLRSDDASQLWLNKTGPSPAGKVKIAEETGCCKIYQNYGSPLTSEPIYLTPDKGYYLEALLKEGGGDDYLLVAARLDGTGLPNPNPATAPVPDLINAESIPATLFGAPNALPGVAGTLALTQTPADQTVLQNAHFTFDAMAANEANYPICYQWSRWDKTSGSYTNIPGATASSYSSVALLAENGLKFKITASVPGAVTAAEATLNVQADLVAPWLTSGHGSEFMNRVTLRFSEFMDPTSLAVLGNYTLSGGLTPVAVKMGLDGMSAILDLDPTTKLTPNTLYTATIQNLSDLAGNPVDPAHRSVTFRSFVLSLGILNFAVYHTDEDGCNVNVADLTSHENYPDNPQERYVVGSFDSRPIFPTDAKEKYGGRFTGVFIPPTTGNWIFYISSDDAGQLYFNPTGDSPDGAQLIVEEPDCCDPYSQAESAPYALTAGQHYYIEGLYKEGCGGDYMRAAAKLDTDPTVADTLPPISGRYLACYTDPEGVSVNIVTQPADQVNTGGTAVVAMEDFSASDGGFSVLTSGPVGLPWAFDATRGSWSASDQAGCAAAFRWSQLNSPPYEVTTPGAITFSFSHRYSWEADTTLWDAGQLRISINGGPWAVVPEANFSMNGYNGEVGGAAAPNNILLGQRAFTGASAGHSTQAMITSTASLGTFSAGDSVAVQFLGAWDDCTDAAHPNWEVDSLQVSPPVLRALAASEFKVEVQATVPGYPTPPIAYQWQRNRGTGWVDLFGATSATYRFIPAPVADNGAKFRCVISMPGIQGQLLSREATLTFGTAAPPQLTVRQSGADVVISWPAAATGYALEETTALQTPPATSTWSPTPGTPVVAGDRVSLTVSPTGANKYYRLRK